MDKLTIKDIARICGVGVSTVSRAINNESGISEDTKNKILKVIHENGYIPNNSARYLKRSESRTIAVLIKGINNPFFSPMITTFENEIKNRRYTFVLHRVDENQDEIDVAIQLEKEKRLKGIVFLGGYFSHSKEKLEKLTVPFVLSTVGMINNIEKINYSSVSVDDTKESYKIVAYLCKLGHKRIAILSATEDDESIGKLRLEGYKKALFDNNIEFNENLVYYLQSGNDRYSMASGYKAAKKLLKDNNCSAIFAITDAIAIGACRAILESGKRIPQDFSVAGYDGLELSKYYTPSLTTIRQPVEAIALETLKVLFDMIDRKGQSIHKVFPGELIVGESTKKCNTSLTT